MSIEQVDISAVLKSYLVDECRGLKDYLGEQENKWKELLAKIPISSPLIGNPNHLANFISTNLNIETYGNWIPAARYLMVECRKYYEPTWDALNEYAKKQWFLENIPIDLLWTCEKGNLSSNAYITFRNHPIKNSLKRFGEWLIENSNLIRNEEDYSDIRTYLPIEAKQDLSTYRGVALHLPYSCDRQLTYRLVQGSHRLFQAIYQGQETIDAYTVCLRENCTIHKT